MLTKAELAAQETFGYMQLGTGVIVRDLLDHIEALEKALLNCQIAMTKWAEDEDGVPEEAWGAYQEAHILTDNPALAGREMNHDPK